MRKYYDALRIHYAYLAEYNNVGGWIGNRIDNAAYFPVNTLFEWVGYIDEAYKAIESLKESDTALYNQLYDRICLESLAPRYLIMSLYGEQVYASGEFSAKKLTQEKKPSIRKLLSSLKEKAAGLNTQRDKVKNKDREVSL